MTGYESGSSRRNLLGAPGGWEGVEATGPGTAAGEITARKVPRPPRTDLEVEAGHRFRTQRSIAVVALLLFAITVAYGLYLLLSRKAPSSMWLVLLLLLSVLAVLSVSRLLRRSV